MIQNEGVMIDEVLADKAHYRAPMHWWASEGFWATATYRLGHWGHSIGFTPARLAVLSAYKVAAFPWRLLKNVSIPAKSKIGAGLCLHHPHNILVPIDAEIGNNCTIYHEVTLGRGPIPGVPKLGNNVVVYAGAKILGGVRIGDNVEIGANCVVTRDIEAGAVVAAPAARSIPREMRDHMRAPEHRLDVASTRPAAPSSAPARQHNSDLPPANGNGTAKS